jgi:hypothetical protein
MLRWIVPRVTRRLIENRFLWRYFFNLTPTLRFRAARRPLSPEGARLLADLNAKGIATTTVDRLLPADSLYGELVRSVDDLVVGAEVSDEARPYTHRENLLGDTPVLDPQAIFARFAVQDAILSVINEYFGMFTQLRKYAVFWNRPVPGAPTVNQTFHRDGSFAYMLLRSFVYLNDIDEESGPFTYYAGTHSKSDHARAAFADIAAGATPMPVTGPKGTVVLADTRGFHRGGLCRTKGRLLYTCLYTSPAVGVDYFDRSAKRRPTTKDAAGEALAPPRRCL